MTIRITNPEKGETYEVGDVFTDAVRSKDATGWYVKHLGSEEYYIADRECEVVTIEEDKPETVRIRMLCDCEFYEEEMPEGSEWFVSEIDSDGDYWVEFEPGETAVVSVFEAEEIPGDISEVFNNIRNQQSAPKHDDSVDAALSIAGLEPLNGIDSILSQRGQRYGEFHVHAQITQDLKDVLHASPNWGSLPNYMKESLEMTAHKIGRILNGDPMYDDSWVDIIGYTQLVVDKINGINK